MYPRHGATTATWAHKRAARVRCVSSGREGAWVRMSTGVAHAGMMTWAQKGCTPSPAQILHTASSPLLPVLSAPTPTPVLVVPVALRMGISTSSDGLPLLDLAASMLNSCVPPPSMGPPATLASNLRRKQAAAWCVRSCHPRGMTCGTSGSAILMQQHKRRRGCSGMGTRQQMPVFPAAVY